MEWFILLGVFAVVLLLSVLADHDNRVSALEKRREELDEAMEVER